MNMTDKHVFILQNFYREFNVIQPYSFKLYFIQDTEFLYRENVYFSVLFYFIISVLGKLSSICEAN